MGKTICERCKDNACTKTGKPCEAVENILNDREIRGYTDRHRRRKEVVYDPHKIEDLGARVAFKLRYGSKYNANNGSDEG